MVPLCSILVCKIPQFWAIATNSANPSYFSRNSTPWCYWKAILGFVLRVEPKKDYNEIQIILLLVKYVGCIKCKHAFERLRDRTNYIGFDCASWEIRSSEHKRDTLCSKNAATAMERKEIRKETGPRYSELHRLPYYDPIRMHYRPNAQPLFGNSKTCFCDLD